MLKISKFIYILMLSYIIAALLFWGFSLQKLNKKIYEYEVISLNEHIDKKISPDLYKKELDRITKAKQSRNNQYLGEGFSFIVVIIFAAIIVYHSIKNNLLFSKRQTNFMLSITHELKSPISAVKLNLETLQRRKLDEETQAMLVQRCINETNRLNDLCNNLLLASQMESKHFQASLEVIDLEPIVQDSVQLYLQRTKHDIYDETEPALIKADPFLIKLAINNLLENATKYSLPGTRIDVNLKSNEDQIIISVADEGGGIPDEEKENIFKKFYRVGSENSRKTKGTGLGLYLVSQIVDLNKGSIIVRDNKPLGTIFEITLPKNA